MQHGKGKRGLYILGSSSGTSWASTGTRWGCGTVAEWEARVGSIPPPVTRGTPAPTHPVDGCTGLLVSSGLSSWTVNDTDEVVGSFWGPVTCLQSERCATTVTTPKIQPLPARTGGQPYTKSPEDPLSTKHLHLLKPSSRNSTLWCPVD